ncbi:hypothetical protein AVEN_25988-1 [Araneus ventricosus]|uniref:Uncharacterized protein n=1 Tax=Araneus ventricosus TaxID=182803 RepID=A0A4Y2TU53_ARAVE|nr:hypothetical protein AVEN_25988-1 [Araneus ventricosus]
MKPLLTPSQNSVLEYPRGVREHGQEDEVVQVEPLHQDPAVVRHQAVLPDARQGLAEGAALYLKGVLPIALVFVTQLSEDRLRSWFKALPMLFCEHNGN